MHLLIELLLMMRAFTALPLFEWFVQSMLRTKNRSHGHVPMIFVFVCKYLLKKAKYKHTQVPKIEKPHQGPNAIASTLSRRA